MGSRAHGAPEQSDAGNSGPGAGARAQPESRTRRAAVFTVPKVLTVLTDLTDLTVPTAPTDLTDPTDPTDPTALTDLLS
jgi:hypothetical protein